MVFFPPIQHLFQIGSARRESVPKHEKSSINTSSSFQSTWRLPSDIVGTIRKFSCLEHCIAKRHATIRRFPSDGGLWDLRTLRRAGLFSSWGVGGSQFKNASRKQISPQDPDKLDQLRMKLDFFLEQGNRNAYSIK
ncbi:hypothetical protein Tco_1144609 [Tanacetum coccineum]